LEVVYVVEEELRVTNKKNKIDAKYQLHRHTLESVTSAKYLGLTFTNKLQWLYSKAITPFWDLQFGVKQDFQPKPQRHWGVILANDGDVKTNTQLIIIIFKYFMIFSFN
jgi:hypothetical protein